MYNLKVLDNTLLRKDEKYMKNNKTFEEIKHIDEYGEEFWYARELMIVLQYSNWQNFQKIIEKAITSCENSDISAYEHFTDVSKTIKMPKGAQKTIKDYKLSRYACYLIAQNGDPRKEVIALAQTYFAVQTRKQEISEQEYRLLSEDEKRLYTRKHVKEGNFALNRTAINAGVKDLAQFHNSGYKGLYNGETADDIAKRKGLRYREEILDNMGSEELAANLFRITQTNSKIKNEQIQGEANANDAHYEVGKIVREAIHKAGGTMPENLPTPEKSIKQLKKEQKNKELKKENI